MHVVQSTICKQSMDATCLLSASWSPPSTPCKLKLMACLLQQRMQRRNQRRPWWTLHALLTSLEPSRTMQILWELQRTLLETNLESLKVALPMPRMLLWLKWRERFVSLRLSLHLLSLALGKHLRLSRGLSARLKSSPLPKEKTERTRTACLSLLQNSKGRSKPTSSR